MCVVRVYGQDGELQGPRLCWRVGGCTRSSRGDRREQSTDLAAKFSWDGAHRGGTRMRRHRSPPRCTSCSSAPGLVVQLLPSPSTHTGRRRHLLRQQRQRRRRQQQGPRPHRPRRGQQRLPDRGSGTRCRSRGTAGRDREAKTFCLRCAPRAVTQKSVYRNSKGSQESFLDVFKSRAVVHAGAVVPGGNAWGPGNTNATAWPSALHAHACTGQA